MFFNTIQYLIFLPIVLILYYLTNVKYRWAVLFLSSCIFYMYFIPVYIFCLFFLILVDFTLAKKIHLAQNLKTKKILLILSITSNFGLLFYFKYFVFFTESLNQILIPLFNSELKISETILPIGLSFHTFQSVSYILDVYRNKIKPENHLGIYSTYVLFFPQMVAGPIERFTTLGNELKKSTNFKFDFIKKAIPLILIGLFYKMVIADNCGEYVNETYLNITNQNNYNIVIAILFFCIQIYSDFFGYSLIAQGSAKLFGIKLIDNFSFPFFSENIIVFWRKWHISLTSWFRDYVYFALGGSKKSKLKHCLNIVIVFSLSGLWHGAGINFILWGFLHAVLYLLSIYFFKKINISIPKLIGYIFTFILVAIVFVFFRSGKVAESITILKSSTTLTQFIDFKPISLILLLNILFVFFIEYSAKKFDNYSSFLLKINFSKKLLLFAYIMFAILTFSGIDNLPFIYFQF